MVRLCLVWDDNQLNLTPDGSNRAAVAEHEREAISERTKATLALSKVAEKPDLAGAAERTRAGRKALAAQFATQVLPILRDTHGRTYQSQSAGTSISTHGTRRIEGAAAVGA